jgi:hypothetical protein
MEKLEAISNREMSCCHSMQSVLFYCLLPRKYRVKTYMNMVVPIVLYECDTWYVALREERRLSVFENRMLRRLFGP